MRKKNNQGSVGVGTTHYIKCGTVFLLGRFRKVCCYPRRRHICENFQITSKFSHLFPPLILIKKQTIIPPASLSSKQNNSQNLF